MYIIDKNKDYYDYLSHIYGVDKTVTFDRRGSVPLPQDRLRDLVVHQGNAWNKTYYFILEVGYIQYLFQIENVKQIKKPDIEKCIGGIWDGEWKLLRTFTETNHFFEKEISIVPCKVKELWDFKNRHNPVITTFKETIEYEKDKIVELPILGNTIITSLLDSFAIWNPLSNYISSKNNDKDIDLKMTDVEKAINHGFDKKSSFRNPIKFKE